MEFAGQQKKRREEEAVATSVVEFYRKVGLRSSHNVLCLDKDADGMILTSRAG